MLKKHQTYEDLLDQRITQSTYDKNYTKWRERQAVLRKKRMSVQKADEDYYITATYLLKLASKASVLYESSEPEEKRLLLNMVVQNATLNGTIVDYDLKKPFDTILVSANSQSWLPRVDMQLRCLFDYKKRTILVLLRGSIL